MFQQTYSPGFRPGRSGLVGDSWPRLASKTDANLGHPAPRIRPTALWVLDYLVPTGPRSLTSHSMSALDVVGAIASIAGFFLSLWVLSVATDARKAAQAAQALAQKRDLAEDLDYASHKLQDVGNFLHLQEWLGVQLRVDEVLGLCHAAMTRWPGYLSEERRNDMLTAMSLIESIASRSAELLGQELSPMDKKRLATAHARASGLINGVRGEARRHEQGDHNDGN